MTEREHKFASAMRNNEERHFHNEDMQAGVDFETALKLGCFDQEFLYYAVGYDTPEGIACRVSGKELRIRHFVRDAAKEGYAVTPVRTFVRRRPAPSGMETQIREEVKQEAAKDIFQSYPEEYFRALSTLNRTEATNAALPLLKNWQEELDGTYHREWLDLFMGLALTALESKVLKLKDYLTIQEWADKVYRQLDTDILPKGQHKKTMAAVACTRNGKDWKYLYDAREEVIYGRKEELEQDGHLVTPVFVRTLWITDMSRFSGLRQQFKEDYEEYGRKGYLNGFLEIKNTASRVSNDMFDDALNTIPEAYPKARKSMESYRMKWNVK